MRQSVPLTEYLRPSLRAVLCLCVVLLRCFSLISSFNRCGQFLVVLVKCLPVLYDVTAKGSYNMCVINHKSRQYIGDEFDVSVIREQIPSSLRFIFDRPFSFSSAIVSLIPAVLLQVSPLP